MNPQYQNKKNAQRFCVLIFLLFSATLTAQGARIKLRPDWHYRYNDFFRYNVYTTHGVPWNPHWIDTFNLCRVRRTHIKSVTVYEFNSRGDSSVLTVIHYDTNGLSLYKAQYADTAKLNCIACNSLFPSPDMPRKTVRREPGCKQVWIRDTAGYITEHRYFNRGSLSYRIFNAIVGPGDHKRVYTYNEDHTEVTEWKIPKRYFSVFRRWTRDPHHRYEYKMDAQGNLLSEFSYDMRWGQDQLVEGFKYYYEYYQ